MVTFVALQLSGASKFRTESSACKRESRVASSTAAPSNVVPSGEPQLVAKIANNTHELDCTICFIRLLLSEVAWERRVAPHPPAAGQCHGGSLTFTQFEPRTILSHGRFLRGCYDA